MKNIFKIFRRDLKNILKNRAAMAIVIGLFFVPSLYAWVNIKACWNPYVNTGNLPVAVVNNDKGATINGKNINIGNDIVKELKNNKDIGWKFVGNWEGNYGLNEGEYYALIEIPSDFSTDLASLATSDPERPNIIYKANQKVNAIATKITDVAQSKLTDEIKTNFIKTVNEEAFKYLNELGTNLETNKPKFFELKDAMNEAGANMQKIQNQLDRSSNNSKEFSNYLKTVKNDLPNITDGINSLQSILESNKSLITNTRINVNDISNSVKNDLLQIQMINSKYSDALVNLKEKIEGSQHVANINENMDKVNESISSMKQMLNSINEAIDSDISILSELNNKYPNLGIQTGITVLNGIKDEVNKEIDALNKLQEAIGSGNNDKIKESLDNLITLNNEMQSKISSGFAIFYSTVIPAINSISDALEQGINIANTALDGSRIIVPQLNALASLGISSGSVASSQIDRISDKVGEFKKELDKVRDKTKDINNETIDDLINIMKKNPKTMASFMSSPINVKEEEIYDTGIFGVALTPFYTVLGIWVGALLMTSMLTTECKEFEDGTENPTLLQEHFGKMLLFLSISIVQTIIVTVGDIFVLGIRPESYPLMFGFAFASCITFSIITYTLASLFGNVGKAIAIVIMVFQVAGAGGIYPIQTTPKIFEILQPLWPFTYAIDGFREAIAGPIWADVTKDLKALMLFVVSFLILGLLKKHFHKLTMFMEHKFKEAQI